MAWEIEVEKGEFQGADRGLQVQEGWHKIRVHDTYDDAQTGKRVFELKIISEGASFGGVINHVLRPPEACVGDSDGGDFAKKCTKATAKRLGVWKENQEGRVSVDFDSVLANGGFVGVLKVVANRYQSNKNGGWVDGTKPDPFGPFALDHPDIPVSVRIQLGLPLLPGQAAEDGAAKRGRGRPAGAANKPKAPVDTSDI